MSQFDANEYFNRLSESNTSASKLGETQDKFASIVDARRRAVTALNTKALDIEQRNQQIAEASKDSLVTLNGLDPDSVAGQVANLGASVYSGTSRVAGDIAGFVAGDLEAIVRDASLSEEQISAVGRYKQGTATPEDVALINARRVEGAYSPLEVFDKATEARTRSSNINEAFDRSGTVHTGRRTELTEQLGQNFQGAWDQTKTGASTLWGGDLAGSKDLASGLAKLVYNAGEAAVSNPGAASEYIAENIPQLAIGAFGAVGKGALLTSNAGYASESYQKGIAKYQAENNGAYPPAEKRQEMALYAASIALAEQVVDTSLLKSVQGAADAVKSTGKTGLIQSLKNTADAALKGTGAEALTEGWQTFAEGEASLSPASAAEIYEGAVIGGIAGGGLAGGGRAVGELLKATPEYAAERATQQAQQTAQEAAITTGDVSALVDPKSPTYAPSKAITALSANSAREDVAPEAKQANLEKAGEIVAMLQAERDSAQASYDEISPEGLAQTQQLLTLTQKKLETETDPVKVQQLQEDEAMFKEQIDSAPKVEAKQIKAAQEKLAIADKLLGDANNNLVRFNEDLTVSSSTVDVKAAATLINTPVDEKDAVALSARSAAATSVINLSMAIPDNLSTAVAESLANNTSNGLTPAQRTYLREFSAARLAQNAISDTGKVADEILYGTKDNLGIVDHRKNIAAALSTGNQKLADSNLALLTKFEESHRTKAQLAQQALDDHLATGKNTQIIREGTGWKRNTGKLLLLAEAKKNGAITVHMNGVEKVAPVIASMQKEAVAITTALTEMQAAYAIKFATQGATNVPVVPQAAAQGQDPTVANQAVQAPSVAGAEGIAPGSAPVQPVAGAVAGTAGVVSPGVGSPVAPVAQPTESTAAQTSVEAQAAPAAGVNQAADEATGQDQSNAGAETNTEDAPTESTETTSKEPVRGLTVLREAKPESVVGKSYRAVNKVVAFLTQKQSKVEKDSDIKAARPLVDLPNLLSQWNEDDSVVESFFATPEFSDEQRSALRTFKTFANKWSEGIKKNFIKGSLPNSKGNLKKADQLYLDPMQDFLNEDGRMDENVVTAIAYAGHSWLVNSTMAPALMKKEAILEMHGLDEDSEISSAGFKGLTRMSAFEDSATNSIGSLVVAALGLKANPNAPQDYLSKVAAAFGVHALQMLKREGLVTLETIPAETLAEYMPEFTQSAGSEFQYYSYIKIVRDPETLKPVGDGKAIVESVKGSQGVVDKLFDAEHVPMEASREPIPFKQQFAKGTKQTLSKKQRRILQEAQKQENRIIPDMWQAMQVLGNQVILKAAGWKDLSGSKIQANNIDAVAAQNNNLESQLDGMVDLVDPANLNQPFYANFEVWKNFRVGVTTRNMNLQSSKIHRFMFARPDWVSTINLADTPKVDSFLVSVAQALGIKIDQQPNAETLVILNNRLNSESDQTVEMAKLLSAAIKDPATNQLTDAQKEAIADMASGAEGMQTLQALVAFGRYLEAKDAGAQSFTATMLVGVDGKTNGPILSHLALGAAASTEAMFDMMNRGGMYSLASGIKHFSDWYQDASSLDLYEDLARAVLTSLSVDTPGLKSIAVITKDLLKDGKVTSAGRKIVKTPLTSFAFGSSVAKSLENMQGAFVQAVFDRIEDLANGRDPRLKREALISGINEMFTMGGLPQSELIDANETVEVLLDWVVTPAQEQALASAFNQVLGEKVKSTMLSYFDVFIQRRDAVNKSIQASFQIYEAIYQDLRTKELDRLVESGEVDHRMEKGKKVPIHDMTVGQEAALRKKVEAILPQSHTAYTQGTGDLGSGLMMAKQTRSLGTSSMYGIEVQMGQPFTNPAGKQSIQVISRGMQQGEVSPGVAGLPYLMHSTDSHIMHDGIGSDLNVHDEAANAADRVAATAQRINGSTWSTMLQFSPASEAYEMLERAVMNAVKMTESGDVSSESLTAISTVLKNLLTKEQNKKGVPLADLVSMALSNAKQQEYQANIIRLETMSQMGSVDQYTWEGGEYAVTDDDRGEATKMLEAARKQGSKLSFQAAQAAQELGKVLQSAGSKAWSAKKAEMESDLAEAITSPFGTLGTPTISSDPGLVSFFEANPDTTAGAVMTHLYKKLGGTGRMAQFNRELLKQLYKSVSKGTKVKYVTAATAESAVLEKPNGPSRGWFIGTADGQEVIYILSNEFTDSGLDAELLLHELTHGALSRIIEKPQGDQVALVAELNTLWEKAKAYAQDKGVTDFEAQLVSLQEFVAWGMTNEPFQRQVISQVTMQTKTGKSSLVNGMKAFINTLTEILFSGSTKSKQAQNVNGMTILIKNVSGLLGQAEQNTQTSTGTAVNLSMAADPVGKLNTYTTLDIHNALNAGDVTPEFDTKLQNILGGIVEKLHGPFGTLKAAMMKNQALTAVDVWEKALATGQAPFALSVNASPLKVSDKELHVMEQVEATVRAALERDVSTTSAAHRGLNKLFTEAQGIIKPSDFATQDEYDYIFKVELGANGRSEHLARFAAFGLAHQEVNKLLQKNTATRTSQVKSNLAEKLLEVWEDLLEFFQAKVTSTYSGQRADLKLLRLVDQLVDIEAKKRTALARQGSAISFWAPTERGAKRAVEAGINKVVEIAGSKFVRDSSNNFVRAAGSAVRVVAGNKVDEFLEGFVELRNQQWKDRLGFVAGTLNYAISGSKVYEGLLRERKGLEGARKDIITNRSRMALEFFANNGKDLKKPASEAITKVFLRTGMHVLYGPGKFNLGQLENLIGNKAAMDAEIAGLEAQLNSFGPFKDDFIDQAASLAYFLATGRNKAEVLMMNAHNISRAYGTAYVGRLTDAQSKQAEPVIEKLIALYAMEYTDSKVLKEAKEVLRTENARTDGGGNGVGFVLDLHRKLEQESRERLFKGQEALMRHGYTPEIYSPHIDVLTADEAGGEALMRRGYEQGSEVTNDPAHPDQSKKRLYVLKGGGLNPYLTGIASYDGKQAQGSKAHSGYLNVNTADGLVNASMNADIMNAKQRTLAKGPRRDMTKARGNFLAPVVNPQGAIVNWRYMMQASTKDSVLQRENRFNLVLGTLAGSIYSKETVTEVNVKVFNAMKEQYEAEKGTKSNAYVLVGPKSPEKELREIWAMIPEESKNEAKRIWGRDGMYVRNDQRDIIFGYRKLSLSDAIKNTQKRRQEAAEREVRGMAPVVSSGLLQDAEEAMAKFFTLAVEHALVLHARTQGYKNPEEWAERAAVKVARGEKMWMELVGELKDLIVIKTITVMAGNLKSNLSLLILSGIPIKDIVRDHFIAWKGATAYQRDTTELDRLQTLEDLGQGTAQSKSQIARLKDAIARNPIRELIEAGLMPTIVEDVAADAEADPYSYKSALTTKMDDLTSQLHPGVKTVARNIYMARDTKIYQTLRQITQLSDFMARYSQFQYLTTRKDEPMSKADAIQQSSDDFINYDIPMHRGMQYLDDAGIMPFMKYFLRVQKVIARLAKDNPARVFGAVLLGQFVELGPIVLESSWIHRAGNNPLQWGALGFPGSLDELATVDAALSLVGTGSTGNPTF